jgi:hypothetical protein
MSNKSAIKFALALFKRPIKRIMPLLAVVVVILLAFFDGIDDQICIELYLKKLQSLSEYRIDNTQKYFVTTYYLQNKNRHPNLKHRHKIRHEFSSQKKKLKQEWCIHYQLKWPLEHYQINNKTQKDFQAHHIIPINAGGVNQWWNISPISDENHKELHASIEEHACFSHDFIRQKILRLILKIRESFYEFTGRIDQNRDSIKPTTISKSGATT